jgi:predicted RNA-binding protein with PIN domain
VPRSYAIIDGYNLMHAVGFARPTYGPGDLERCRERFVGRLKELLIDAERPRTIVVFDAAGAPAEFDHRQVTGGMELLFSAPGCDADSLIEELLEGHSAPKQVQVISDDRRLLAAARRRRARGIGSETYWGRLEHRAERAANAQTADTRAGPAVPAKFDGRTSPAETEHWLEVFSDVEQALKKDRPPG